MPQPIGQLWQNNCLIRLRHGARRTNATNWVRSFFLGHCKSGVALADIDIRHIDAQLRSLLCDVLGLEETQVAEFDADTELFGALPELDSMAVAGLLTEMEDRLHITIDDDEVDGELFETYGKLLAFAEGKVGA